MPAWPDAASPTGGLQRRRGEPDRSQRGKGAGYSDFEVALLTGAGLIGPSIVIVTTVDRLQVVDGLLPETGHDFRVELIITSAK